MAAAWGAIGVMTAIAIAFFYYLGAKIDALSSKVDAQGANLGAKIDAQGYYLGTKIDAQGASLGARIDAHIAGHRHAG